MAAYTTKKSPVKSAIKIRAVGQTLSLRWESNEIFCGKIEGLDFVDEPA